MIAALGAEGARQPAPVRSAFAAAARGLLAAIERKLHPRQPAPEPSDGALRLVPTMVGAVVLQACHHFGRRFRERGRGGLVLLSSIAAFQGMPYAAHDAATRAYGQSLAEALQVELQGDGFAVLDAAPGPTHSGFAARAGMRLGAAMDPEAIAHPILDALGRQTTVLPGALSKLLTCSLVPLPRWARVSIMGTVMQGMAGS